MSLISATQLLSQLSLSETLTTKEALSGIFGSISLATWIFLLVPQLWINYQLGSADAISVAFLVVWFIGDIANLSGAVWAGLVPTVIALAVYFCFSDFILITQTLYYNHINARKARNNSVVSAVSEEEPLLTRRRSSEIGLPGSHRRPSFAAENHTGLSKIAEENEENAANGLARNLLNCAIVMVIGTAGWFIAWKSGVWTPAVEDGVGNADPQPTQTAVGASLLGYFSALCYLGARLPQIYKNYKDQSCEGLALGFFMLSTLGNLTYGASILFHSLEKEYIMTTLPWLIGSLGTIAEDIFIFMQFRMYRSKPDTNSAIED